jgi:hypothetical protein
MDSTSPSTTASMALPRQVNCGFRYTDGGNTIIYGDVNGDRVADFSIKLLGHILLYGTDFMGVGT